MTIGLELTTIPFLVRVHPLGHRRSNVGFLSDAHEAGSESSWTALAKGKDRGWCFIDLDGEMEKLEVIGPWSESEGGFRGPQTEDGLQVTSVESIKRGQRKVERS